MTIMEKFENLTQEQREQFSAVKDLAALDAFASQYGIDLTDEERQDMLEYIKTGVLPLGDEELENVAGGLCKDGKGRYVVTLITRCQYNLTGLYGHNPLFDDPNEQSSSKRRCGDGGIGTSRANGWCEYCSKENGKWLCNYPKKILP
jgi:hypothetical protein